MSKSRKRYAVVNDSAKESFKQVYNGKLRTRNRDLINKYLKGEISEDELQFADDPIEVSEITTSPKEDAYYYPTPEDQFNFSDEHPEDDYLEKVERYEKAFRK